jgi:TolB-like protein
LIENTVQRRLAAILVADVVGYSRLMEADEAGTLAALKERRRTILYPVVRGHGGRVIKFMGDGVLVEFASAVKAVEAAIELQAKFASANEDIGNDRRILLRVGVNLGDIVGEGSDIYGDGVNIAARLEALAEPGGMCISAKVYDEIRGKVSAPFDDIGLQSLKNITIPVRAYRNGRGSMELPPPARSERASIAVLPFTNMSSDAEQEYFADGISEDLITDLSKIVGLLVIARNSTFAYKRKAVDIRQVARELGVAYVVEGSVRRAASRVRITVQLINATDGSHVWAERYDRNLEDVFVVQDEVVGKIVRALADLLQSASVPIRRRAPKIAAYDLFVKGRALSMNAAEANRLARPLLEKACRTDPEFADAHAWLAMNLHYGWMYCHEEDSRERAFELAKRAVSLDPANADAHVVLGYLEIFDTTPDLDGGREQFTTALKLNHNHADAWIFLADLETLEGRTEEALHAARTAFRLNPRPPSYYFWLFSWALYAARRYEDVIEMVGRDPARSLGSQRLLAGALAQLGRLDEAREVGCEFMRQTPNFTIGRWVKTLPVRNPSQLDHFIEGYRKAGLPD